MDNFILLPTGKFPEVGQLNLVPHNRPGHQLEVIHYVETGAGLQPQHLYHVSKEEIERLDYYYDPFYKVVRRKQTPNGNNGYEDYYKVVASTDNTLCRLPLIPKEVVQEYIQHYNQVPA